MGKLYLETLMTKIRMGMPFEDILSDIEGSTDISENLANILLRRLKGVGTSQEALNSIEDYYNAKYFAYMVGVAKFEKVSYEVFLEDMRKAFPDLDDASIEFMYENHVTLPKRSSSDSVLYDIYSPVTVTIEPGCSITIPTGIRCNMLRNYVLMCFNGGSANVIDSQHYFSNKEGHIVLKVTNNTDDSMFIFAGSVGWHGIFTQCGVAMP